MPIYLGPLDRVDSLSLYALPGGRTIQEYYDGAKDKLLNYEISIKTMDQRDALEILDKIANSIENTKDIKSLNNSYEFQNITISSESYYRDQDEQGFYYYQLTFQSKITIYKEDI